MHPDDSQHLGPLTHLASGLDLGEADSMRRALGELGVPAVIEEGKAPVNIRGSRTHDHRYHVLVPESLQEVSLQVLDATVLTPEGPTSTEEIVTRLELQDSPLEMSRYPRSPMDCKFEWKPLIAAGLATLAIVLLMLLLWALFP